MTLGETRVRTKFNPSENGTVDQIKQTTAELIDVCELLRMDACGVFDPERARCVALAQTHYETAAMFAVKAATA
jgi:hypothetical protein